MLITESLEFSPSLSLLLIGMDVMFFIFVISLIASICCAVPITLLVTDCVTMVDVFGGTPLGTSDQSVHECNVTSTLRHRTNRYSVRSAVRSLISSAYDFYLHIVYNIKLYLYNAYSKIKRKYLGLCMNLTETPEPEIKHLQNMNHKYI